MNIEDCIDSAKNSLDRARRELDSGHGCNLVPGELSDALARAMEAWLLAHGHKNNCHGLDGYITFTGHAPEELASEFRRCWAETSTLEFLLLGDATTDAATLPPLEEWKARADNCIISCENVVGAITQALHAQNESQA